MKITTKRFCAGEYKVFRDGTYTGMISNFTTEKGVWAVFDEDNNLIGTTDTKWYYLDACAQDNEGADLWIIYNNGRVYEK